MKHPKKGDTIGIKDDSTNATANDEAVFDVACDPAHLPHGLKITIATKRNYQQGKQYWIIGSNGEQVGASVQSIQTRKSDDWKSIVFFTLINES